MILDPGLPDMDGLQVIRELRSWSAAPIIILSARQQEGDKVLALDAGADDYLTNAARPRYRLTEPGVGYRLRAEVPGDMGDHAVEPLSTPVPPGYPALAARKISGVSATRPRVAPSSAMTVLPGPTASRSPSMVIIPLPAST